MLALALIESWSPRWLTVVVNLQKVTQVSSNKKDKFVYNGIILNSTFFVVKC